MPVINKHLARWYRETSQHLRAGFPLPRAWATAGGVPQRDRTRLAQRLEAGEPIEAVLNGAPRWMPDVDRHVLASAARSGQLVETLLVLSEQRATSGRQAARAVAATIYPLFLVHFAALALPLHIWFSQDFEAYAQRVFPVLLPLWTILGVLAWAALRRHRWLAFCMRLLPLFRGAIKSRNLANLTFTLYACLVAGETISAAWKAGGTASGDGKLRRLAENVAEQARQGVPPSEPIGKTRALPEDFVSLYQTGEQTGQLAENLKYLWGLYSERATEKLQSAVFWYTKGLFLLVAVGIAFVVIRAYVAQFERALDWAM